MASSNSRSGLTHEPKLQLLAGPLGTIRYDKGTWFTELKGHSLHFLSQYFVVKTKCYALERNNDYGTKSRIYLRMVDTKIHRHRTL